MRRIQQVVLCFAVSLTGCTALTDLGDLSFEPQTGWPDVGPRRDARPDAEEDGSSPFVDAGDSGREAGMPDADAAELPDTAIPLPDTGPDADTGTADEAGADMSTPDTGPTDDAGNDAFVDPDMSIDDSGPDAWSDPDTGPEADAFVDPDTGPVDSGPPDTGPVDTGPPDSGPPDTGPVEMPCADGSMPAQVYNADMVGCDGLAASQCAAATLCGPGWHICTWSEYLARGGRTVPSTGTTGRWIRSCRRDVGDRDSVISPTDDFCSSCGFVDSWVIPVGNLCPAGTITEGDYPLGMRTTVEPLITRQYDSPCAFAMAIRPSYGGLNGAICCQ